MAKIKLARAWFGPDAVHRDAGVHEVPKAFLEKEGEGDDAKFKHLPKTAKVLSEADAPSEGEEEKAPVKAAAKK